jgi:hypothetical protein
MFQRVYLFLCIFSLRNPLVRDTRSVNTAVEFSKIRQALALVEAHVNYIQQSPGLSGGITPRLKEEPSNPSKSDSSDPEAPGVRGQSSQSGLYAGPTSTVSLLTPVCLLRVSHSAE